MLTTRRCPVSYGVLCREVYNPERHRGEDVEIDPFDERRYAVDQVMWFIKQVRSPMTYLRIAPAAFGIDSAP